MARRKFYRSKSSPDRGWLVGRTEQALIAVGASSNAADVYSLFDFADIDAEALTGRIEQDKSDWFVKRCIIDVYCAVSFTGVAGTDVARLYEMAVGVMGDANMDEVDNANYEVISPEAYNLWSRLFQTWVKPVYAGGLLPYGNTGGALATIATAGDPNYFGVAAPFWGPSGWHADFEVSNAGLRNNQHCGLHVSLADGPSAGYDWDNGDTLYLSVFYRFLMQKRRV